ncbi:MAG: glycosyltransferase family A protein [Brasilonema sp.]
MLVFVIPLRSPQSTKSWDSVSQLFERCIKSVCNQTSSKFRVIVVCHEKPNFDFSHSHLTYIKVNFLSPSQSSVYKVKELDRSRKVVIGLKEAKKLDASHVMIADADDCVSKHLAEFVSNHSQKNGWVFKKGYWYQENLELTRLMKKGFDCYCGTSQIVKSNFYEFSETANEEEKAKYYYDFYRHRKLKDFLEEKEIILAELPFAGAVYTVGHGENIFTTENRRKINLKNLPYRLKAWLEYRPITSKIREEFGLYKIDKL